MTDSNATELKTIIKALEKLASAVAWTMPNDSASVRTYLAEAFDAIAELKELIADAQPPLDKLLRCLENDYGITASWDGLRKVWLTESTAALQEDEAATLGGGEYEIETYHRCKHCGAFFEVINVCPNCGNAVER